MRRWTATAPGKTPLITVRCGCPRRWLPAGHRIATAVGCGSTLGAGPGSMMRRGALRHSITAVGPTGIAAGAGCPGRAWCARFMHPRWWRLAGIHRCMAVLIHMAPAWRGSRWHRANTAPGLCRQSALYRQCQPQHRLPAHGAESEHQSAGVYQQQYPECDFERYRSDVCPRKAAARRLSRGAVTGSEWRTLWAGATNSTGE